MNASEPQVVTPSIEAALLNVVGSIQLLVKAELADVLRRRRRAITKLLCGAGLAVAGIGLFCFGLQDLLVRYFPEHSLIATFSVGVILLGVGYLMIGGRSSLA